MKAYPSAKTDLSGFESFLCRIELTDKIILATPLRLGSLCQNFFHRKPGELLNSLHEEPNAYPLTTIHGMLITGDSIPSFDLLHH